MMQDKFNSINGTLIGRLISDVQRSERALFAHSDCGQKGCRANPQEKSEIFDVDEIALLKKEVASLKNRFQQAKASLVKERCAGST